MPGSNSTMGRAMYRSRRQTLHAFALAAVLGAGTMAAPDTLVTVAAQQAPTQDDTIQAIWRIHRVDFVYHSPDVYYDCEALQAKIADILRAVGAHRHVQVAMHCTGGQMVNYAHASVTVALPEEATQANVKAATTFDTRAQMVAQLRKLSLPTPADIERFPARWQTVRLSHQHRVDVGAGDCDLLRDMHRQVFPKLPVHIIRHNTSCTPGAATRIRPKLEVVALIAEQPPISVANEATPSG